MLRQWDVSQSVSKAGRSWQFELMPSPKKGLRKARGTTGWHELKTEDGEVRLDLGRVVYVQADSGDSRVGFG